MTEIDISNNKITCGCGSKITKRSLHYHNKSIKHKKYEKTKEIIVLLFSKKVPTDIRLLILEHIFYHFRRHVYRKKHALKFQFSVYNIKRMGPQYSKIKYRGINLTKVYFLVYGRMNKRGGAHCAYFQNPSKCVYYKNDGDMVKFKRRVRRTVQFNGRTYINDIPRYSVSTYGNWPAEHIQNEKIISMSNIKFKRFGKCFPFLIK